MDAQSFEHLDKVGVRATMEAKLEEQRFVIKFLPLDGEQPCYIEYSAYSDSFGWKILSISTGD